MAVLACDHRNVEGARGVGLYRMGAWGLGTNIVRYCRGQVGSTSAEDPAPRE